MSMGWDPVVRAGAHGKTGEGREEESCVVCARTEERAGAISAVMGLLTQFASSGMKRINMTSNQPNFMLLFEGDLCCKTFNEGFSKMKKGCTFAFS